MQEMSVALSLHRINPLQSVPIHTIGWYLSGIMENTPQWMSVFSSFLFPYVCRMTPFCMKLIRQPVPSAMMPVTVSVRSRSDSISEIISALPSLPSTLYSFPSADSTK